MKIVIDPLMAFYILAAILLLAISIVVYPTLRAKNKK